MKIKDSSQINRFVFVYITVLSFFFLHSQAQYDDNDYYYDSYYDVTNSTEACTVDQFQCPDSDYGIDCIANTAKCNGKFDCTDGSDELDCPDDISNQVFVCDGGQNAVWARQECPGSLECVRLCNKDTECDDGTDERSIGLGFKCTSRIHKGDPSCLVPDVYVERWKSLDKRFHNKSAAICPDSQDICYAPNSNLINTKRCFQCMDGTVISSHQLCDSVVDCGDLSDECMCVSWHGEEQFPDRKIMIKNLCKAQTKKTDSCLEGKIACNINSSECIDSSQLCDGIYQCTYGEDEELCGKPEDVSFQDKSLYNKKNYCYGGTKKATWCDGRPECFPLLEDECHCPGELPSYCKVFGNSSAMILKGCANLAPSQLCDGVYDCDNGEDENCKFIEPCDPMDRSQNTYDVERDRCNLVKNCRNGIDEVNCSSVTHFYCGDEDNTFIPADKIGDHFNDCPNGADECNTDENSLSSGQKMIGNGVLWVIMWIMSFTALAGNMVVIIQTARDLRYTLRRGATAAVSSRVGACNKILVFNLALADFLMGIYLLILNIKSVEFEGSYCSHDVQWRTSAQCENLGVLVVLSSQTSVIIMVMMTSYRLFTIRDPYRAEKLRFRLMSLVVALAWIPAAIVAIIPLINKEQVFAIAVTTKNLFGKYVIEKKELINFLEAAKILRPNSSLLLPDYSWPTLEGALCQIYPKICTDPKSNPIIQERFGYYSQDSVCMPRLYPSVGDGGWKITAVVISFDFVAFVYILLAYLHIYRLTVMQEEGKNTHFWRSSSFSSVLQQRSKEDKMIWHRITRLLVTDCLCWIPICVMTFASLAGLRIPTIFYQISAIVLLPINSALNPILYSNAIPLACYSLAAKLCPGRLKGSSTLYSFRKSRRNRHKLVADNNNYKYNKNKLNSAVANLAANCSESNGTSKSYDKLYLNKLSSKNPSNGFSILSPDSTSKNSIAVSNGNTCYKPFHQELGQAKKLSVSTDGLATDNQNSTAPILMGRTSTSTCASVISSNSDRRHSFSLKPVRRILARCFDTRSKSLRDTRVSDPFVDELPLNFRRPKSRSSVSTNTQCTALPTDTDTIY